MSRNEEIVAEARGWLGTRWVHQGRNRQGIDCVGLLVMVARNLEIADYDYTDYPRRPDGTFIQHFAKVLKPLSLDEAGDGDVLIFAQGGHACHCGIRATRHGRPSIIHSHARRKAVIEEDLKQAVESVGVVVRAFGFPGDD